MVLGAIEAVHYGPAWLAGFATVIALGEIPVVLVLQAHRLIQIDRLLAPAQLQQPRLLEPDAILQKTAKIAVGFMRCTIDSQKSDLTV